MAFTPFRTLLGPEPPVANQTTVTGGTTIALLWDTPNLSPVPASNVAGSPLVANTVYSVKAWGVATIAATAAQTATFTPIFGTTTGGTSLGASIAAPISATALTNVPWMAEMLVHFRSTGASGTATCGGTITGSPFVGVAAGTTQGTVVNFGTASTTATTVNTTAAQGLALAITPSLATQSWTCLGVVAESLN